jgi:hypothetical protein
MFVIPLLSFSLINKNDTEDSYRYTTKNENSKKIHKKVNKVPFSHNQFQHFNF